MVNICLSGRSAGGVVVIVAVVVIVVVVVAGNHRQRKHRLGTIQMHSQPVTQATSDTGNASRVTSYTGNQLLKQPEHRQPVTQATS